MLLLRIDSTEQVDPRQLSEQRLVCEMCQSIAGKHPGDRHSNFGKDMTSNEFVVAGQHLHGDAGGCHRLDRAPRAGFRRIKKDGEPRENEVALFVDRGGSMTRIDQAAGKAQRSEPLRA